MSSAGSSKKIYTVFLLAVLAIIVLVVLFPGRRLRQRQVSAPQETFVSQTPTPSTRLQPLGKLREQAEPEKLESRGPEIPETLVPTALRVYVEDALGEPIPRGFVTVDGQRKRFEHGLVIIEQLPPAEHTLIASASGYRSATQTVSLPTTKEVRCTLEYLCSFDISVRQPGRVGLPVRGAEVLVWKGPPVRRPVPSRVTVTLAEAGTGFNRLTLERDGKRIRVAHVEWSGRSVGTPPEVGDELVGVAELMWRARALTPLDLGSRYLPLANPTSPRLRVWDAMVAYAESTVEGVWDDRIELERSGSRFSVGLKKQDVSKRGEIVARDITDWLGKCSFRDLPAGTYYVQARKDSKRSPFAIIHPARAGAELRLADGCMVEVSVRRAAGQRLSAVPIAEAQVTLTPSAGSNVGGVFSGKTNRDGRAEFRSVPWGRYDLTVIPPEESSLDRRTLLLVVEDTKERVVVQYESEGEGFEVSGRVVRADTKEPVEGFGLALSLHGEGVVAGARRYARTVSDSDGRFTFYDVPPGDYWLEPLGRRDYTGYLPVGESLLPDGVTMSRTPTIHVVDRDIRNLEYLVLPGTRTRFRGRAVKGDGTPVKGARVFFAGAVFWFVEPDPITAEDGTFDLSIVTVAEESIQDVELVAEVIEPLHRPPPRGMFESSVPRATRRGWVSLRGRCQVRFRFGEIVEGIEIVLEKPEPCVVEGIISTEDGGPLDSIRVYAAQFVPNQVREYPGSLDSRGYYRVEFPEPGPITLHVDSEIRTEVVDRLGPRPVVDYCGQSVELVLTEEQRTQRVDFTLARAVYLGGIVIDEQRRPIADATVVAYSPNNPTKSRNESRTDDNGFFWFPELLPRPYTIEVTLPGADKPAASLQDITPPSVNVVVMLKSS